MTDRINPVKIGSVIVGDEYPTVFMAEVGTFFNQDMELAKSFFHSAVESGADIFKTEILHDAAVCFKDTGLVHRYRTADGEHEEDYRSLIERKVVSLDAYRELFELCRSADIPIVASVYDIEGIDFLKAEGGAAIKISRDNVNNVPLLRHAARTGLPVIMDDGGLYFEEIADAVGRIRREGNNQIIVNHHPAANPAPAGVHQMRVMQTYKQALRVPVGLSCHYRGDEILYVSIGMGANLLEKGIVDNPDRVEQDLVSALALKDVATVVRKVRSCWEALGSSQPVIREPRDYSSWKSLAARRDIAEGETISLDNTGFSFPPLGISVADWDKVENRKVRREIRQGDPIQWGDLRWQESEEQ